MTTCTLLEPVSPRILHLILMQLIKMSDSDDLQLYKEGEREASFPMNISPSDYLPELHFRTVLVQLVLMILVVCFSVFS